MNLYAVDKMDLEDKTKFAIRPWKEGNGMSVMAVLILQQIQHQLELGDTVIFETEPKDDLGWMR
jgi:hypothetical protein